MWRFSLSFSLSCCLWLQWIWLVAGGGDGGWMRWSAVLRIIGLRKRRERGKIKKLIKINKERIFKWNVKKKKKIEVLMEGIL